MSRADVVAKVRDELNRHKPLRTDVTPDSIDFYCNYQSCVCGEWAGPGSCFNDHIASAVVDAITVLMSKTADFNPVMEYHAAQLRMFEARQRMMAGA